MFASREDAGRKLGWFLREQGEKSEVVLGLPRGGVVVAAEVARVLQVPLRVLVVRKLGHPWHREFAIGAIAEGGVSVLDPAASGLSEVWREKLEGIIEEEHARLRLYERQFHQAGRQDLSGKSVVIVDDGIATGATMEAAVKSARVRGAEKVVVAAPIASKDAVARLKAATDDVRILETDPEFEAVGRYYVEFAQTSDEEVVRLLAENPAHYGTRVR